MAYEFHLPDIGEGLTEAVIVEWYHRIGELVELDAPLVAVETDKAVVDIPAPHAGVLLHRGAAKGDTLQVDALLAVVGAEGETWTPQNQPADAVVAPIVGTLEDQPEFVASQKPRPGVLPKVRKLASDLGVDLTAVTSTGPLGRISEDDVRAAAAGASGPTRLVRMSPTRSAVAEHLARSWREIPHVTTYAAADADALLAAKASSPNRPLEALIIARMLPLLGEFPSFNASVVGDEIVERLHYDIGFAVDTAEGLKVAVVRDAPSFVGDELAAEVRRLAAATRDGTATLQELRGQTFTLSNIGAVGGGYGTPIIPYGTTAILSVGRAEPRPVVRDSQVVVGTEFPLSLSYDHRAIDGALGRAFMSALIAALSS